MARKAVTRKQSSTKPALGEPIKIAELPKVHDPAVSTIWVDTMQILVRGDVGVATLRFETALPEAAYEACRLQMSVEHVKRMIEVMCQHVDYYPSRPGNTKKTTRRKKKSP